MSSTLDPQESLELPLLPLRDVVVFPHMVIPLFVGRPKSIKALETAMEAGKSILLVAQKSAAKDEPAEEDLYHVDSVRAGLDMLPGDLGQAIEALKQDEIIQDALGEHVYERYVEAKLLEWNEYRLYVSRWELDRYLTLY